jgi:predicted AlkP superfamily phosphohydrolase/phosphomutase
LSKRKRVFVIGLDCAPPRLVFDEWKAQLPNLARLQEEGIWGKLESCIPPITVPAWSCMLASKDPGQLGFYGFRNRADYSYEKLAIANASSVRQPRVWDLLSQSGKQVILVGVPQTYPARPVNGAMVTCFLTPDTKSPYTYPPSLKEEIEGGGGRVRPGREGVSNGRQEAGAGRDL